MLRFGFSLSLCIGDILRGKVPEDEVGGIRTCTKLTDPEMAVSAYYNSYWSGSGVSAEEVTKLLYRLWSIIEQPRFKNQNYSHDIWGGKWFEANSMSEAVELHTQAHRKDS